MVKKNGINKKIKIFSWNVNGIRAAVKGGLIKMLNRYKPDILCMQEIKTDEETFPTELREYAKKADYELIINSAKKKGYAGTAVLTRLRPLEVYKGIGAKKFDSEGRFLLLKFENFYLFNAYFPHSRRGLIRLKFKLEFNKAYLRFIRRLKEKLKKERIMKPIILVGDFNVAHKEIDLANPKQNEHNAGFTQEERRFIDELIENGYVDVFRHLHPKLVKYSWWTYRFHARERNIGWRLDYFFVPKQIVRRIKKADILSNVKGSDHAPVFIEATL